MAAAHVSGLVALIIERQPRLDPGSVLRVLTSTAVDLGKPGRDGQFGAGLVNAEALMREGSKAIARK